MLARQKAKLGVLTFPDGSHEHSCDPAAPTSGGGADCNLAFRPRAVPPLAVAVALRNEARTILVRLVIKLYIDQRDVKKLAAQEKAA